MRKEKFGETNLVIPENLLENFDYYKISVSKENFEGKQIELLEEKQVIGLEQSIFDFIEFYSQENFPQNFFEWKNENYVSEPALDKSYLVINYTKSYDKNKGIDAILYPNNLNRD